MSSAIWETERGILLKVVVRPRSREKNLVAEISSEVIVLNLNSPAREGKANSELIKKMAKVLSTSTSNITLVAGHKSREKTLLIQGMSLESVRKNLSDMT
ncbi:MAG: DUF167 domain-containing protein [Candidatus Thorarchaeota archaeon]